MKKNMGAIDKAVRILLALVIGTLYGANVISGAIALILLILATVFVMTSFISFCPLYVPFGINTSKKKN